MHGQEPDGPPQALPARELWAVGEERPEAIKGIQNESATELDYDLKWDDNERARVENVEMEYGMEGGPRSGRRLTRTRAEPKLSLRRRPAPRSICSDVGIVGLKRGAALAQDAEVLILLAWRMSGVSFTYPAPPSSSSMIGFSWGALAEKPLPSVPKAVVGLGGRPAEDDLVGDWKK